MEYGKTTSLNGTNTDIEESLMSITSSEQSPTAILHE